VRLPDGRTGWVLNRFLTSDRPKTLQLKQAEEKAADLTEQMSVLSTENQELKTENQTLKETIETTRSELAEVQQSYESLKDNCGDYLQMKESYDAAEKALSEQQKRLDVVEKRLRERNIYLFLSGAGVLVLGFLVGRSGRSSRRRSPYL
jgi:SH3 domain protein